MAFLLGLILLLAAVIAVLVWFTANMAKRVEAMLPNSAPGRAKFFEPGDAVEISWRVDAGRFLTD